MAACMRALRLFTPKSHIKANVSTTVLPRTPCCQYLVNRHSVHTKSLLELSRRSNWLVGPLYRHGRHAQMCGLMAVRFSSSTTEEFKGGAYIPPPPDISKPEPLIDAPQEIVTNALGEPTIQSLGLGAMTPPGIIQIMLDSLHVYCPWWVAIGIVTVIIRTLMFPIFIKGRKNMVNMSNYMPQLQKLKEEFEDARYRNNIVDSALIGKKMQDLKNKANIKISRMYLIPACQIPVFLSMFTALRGMTSLPIESMKEGGLFWFTDLTVPDPFYILPIVTTCTLLLTFEVGSEGMSTANLANNKVKWVMRAVPIITLPIIFKFPTAMLCYWLTSNIFSLIQVLIMKIPNVQSLLNIPDKVVQKGQVKDNRTIKQKWRAHKESIRSGQAMNMQARLDAEAFEKAGKGPIPKTYKERPNLTAKG